ncbi:CBS domain-containing protein [Herbiconiux sp. CPCC 205763]|uniref:CBS domain-containing protein n=1 Tax=Herbiconiux aconitum TaxID=2970913 RepID=A0ABT2GWS7_9MICO|nr:CBS domain-containing protein [Herbiconiux aconitum]MCS5720017.1 CBS domain-containing protein [Herbiconiux aconitum]
MTNARDIMTPDPEGIRESHTLREAAVLMRDLDVGALPILGDGGALVGVITDRDIVVGCVADGSDPETMLVGELADREPVTVEADDDVREALSAMQEHQVRRVPVLEGGRLVGIISQADIALSLSPIETGETVEEISE